MLNTGPRSPVAFDRGKVALLDLNRALKGRLGEGASPEGLTLVLQDARSGRAGPLGHGQNVGSDRQTSMRDWNRGLEMGCPR